MSTPQPPWLKRVVMSYSAMVLAIDRAKRALVILLSAQAGTRASAQASARARGWGQRCCVLLRWVVFCCVALRSLLLRCVSARAADGNAFNAY